MELGVENFNLDVNAFGNLPEVNVYNFSELIPGQLNGLLNGPARPLGHFATAVYAWRHSGSPMDEIEKLYKAMIWIQGSDRPGQRVSVVARSLEEAKSRLESEYGKGNVYYLRNEEDAAAPR